MHERVRVAGLAASVAVRAGGWRTAVVLLCHLTLTLLDAVTAISLKFLVDGATAGDWTRAFAGAFGMASATGLMFTAYCVSGPMQTAIDERASMLFELEMMRLVDSVPTLEAHERPEFIDKLDVLRTNRYVLTGAIWALSGHLSFVVGAGASVLLLASVDARLLLVPVFAIPMLLTGGRAERLRQRAIEASAEPLRAAAHLFEVGTTAAPGKELRVFGLRDEIVSRYESVWDGANRQLFRAEVRGALLTGVGRIAFTCGSLAAVVFTAWRAVNGRATPGDVLLAFTLAGRVQNDVTRATGVVRTLLNTLTTAGRYLWLIDYAAASSSRIRDLPVPDRIADGIRLEHVSFAYPGTERVVLDDVSLFVPAARTVAIVGENGAGKTTFVKLLCGFYEPSSGRITVDGLDLSRIAGWSSKLAGVFQDFANLEFVLRESVGVGDVGRVGDDGAVAAALDRAGARGLPPGDAQLGRQWDGGVDLSGGQWQQVAMGRGMMRDAPLLLVLDEPTAALDADTEHALFERYAGASRRAAITILVSHRFSTVRMADLIVVMDAGRVVDTGTHEDLIARGGLYAELYELQARAYR